MAKKETMSQTMLQGMDLFQLNYMKQEIDKGIELNSTPNILVMGLSSSELKSMKIDIDNEIKRRKDES